MIEGGRSLLLAAACSVHSPQPFYPRQAFREAVEFLDTCRLGQTERGSFVATIVTPVPPVVGPQACLPGMSVFSVLVDGPAYGRIFRGLRGVSIRQPDPLAAFQDQRAVYHDDVGDCATNEQTMDGPGGTPLQLPALLTSLTVTGLTDANPSGIVRMGRTTCHAETVDADHLDVLWNRNPHVLRTSEHNPPHFHAYYQDYTALVAIETGEVLEGMLPSKQAKLVAAWAELRKET